MPIYFQINNQKLPLAIESIGNNWTQDQVQRITGYPCYHWLQTINGVGEIFLEKKSFLLQEGQGIFIAPFVPHSYYPKGQWETCFLTFSGPLSEQIPTIVGSHPYYLAEDSASFRFSEWIDQRIDAYLTQTKDDLQLSIDCYEFLAHINSNEQQTSSAHPLYERYIVPVLREIETNYQMDLTVEDLASSCYVSPQYLTRLFRRFMNVSTYQYLQQYRINKAKILLVNRRELDIQYIGFQVGIKDASHFTALFKKETGYTPRAFRKLHGG